jgi:hypothetical protein
MPWAETPSLSFTARHEAGEADDALAVLEALEEHRGRLEELFPRVPGNVTVVLHDSWLQLAFAQPYLPFARRLASPSARRYMAGWFSSHEVHSLAPQRLRESAGGPDSLEALRLTPLRAYTMLVVGTNNALFPPPFRLGSFSPLLRSAWVLEGAAQFFSGQVPLLRAALAIRLRQGPIRFPPGLRDAPLAAGALFDLLARERGVEACVRLARQPARDSIEALESAFGLPPTEVVSMWRANLDRLSAADPQVTIRAASEASP